MYGGNPNFANTPARQSPFTDFAAMLNRASNPGGYGTQQQQGYQLQMPNVPNSLPQTPYSGGSVSRQPTGPAPRPPASQTASGYNFYSPYAGGQGFGTAAYEEFMHQSLPYFERLLDLTRQQADLYGTDQSSRLNELLRMAQQGRPNSGTYYFAGY